jgi:hypothetical protein
VNDNPHEALWAKARAKYEYEALQEEYHRHSPLYWRVNKWAWRVVAVTFIVALLWVGLTGRNQQEHPHYPTHTEVTR